MNNIIKKIKTYIKGGMVTPAPPIGPLLGSLGINIMEFCNKINKLTINKKGENLPVIILLYDNKKYDIIIKKQSIKDLIFKKLNINKGSSEPKKKIINKIDYNEIKKIAKYKMSDFNCYKLSSAINMIIGTLKSIGIDIIYNNKNI
ncbi:MAG: 50S ribosomal protein L11 [Flavobacteriales endosymbiont of Rhyzopertha dominica]